MDSGSRVLQTPMNNGGAISPIAHAVHDNSTTPMTDGGVVSHTAHAVHDKSVMLGISATTTSLATG